MNTTPITISLRPPLDIMIRDGQTTIVDANGANYGFFPDGQYRGRAYTVTNGVTKL